MKVFSFLLVFIFWCNFSVNAQSLERTKNVEQLVIGAGCFWCVEAIFENLKGVHRVESGYSGGFVKNPTYRQVVSGKTGHAEVVNIIFNPSQISLEELLQVFFTLHNPTTLNQQGADKGTQYRSVIFYQNSKQKKIADRIIASLTKEEVFKKPIVTKVTKFKKFFKAENYHQEYYSLNKQKPYCKFVIKPKIDKLHRVFKEKLKVITKP